MADSTTVWDDVTSWEFRTAGFVVVTFTRSKDPDCPMDHCILDVSFFEEQDAARAEMRRILDEPEGSAIFPHFMLATRTIKHEKVFTLMAGDVCSECQTLWPCDFVRSR